MRKRIPRPSIVVGFFMKRPTVFAGETRTPIYPLLSDIFRHSDLIAFLEDSDSQCEYFTKRGDVAALSLLTLITATSEV
jgi:hypothetical protein